MKGALEPLTEQRAIQVVADHHNRLCGTKVIAETDLPAMAKAILDLLEHFKPRRYRSRC